MYNFKPGENRSQKIDIFLDNLSWYFSSKPMNDATAIQTGKLVEQLVKLNENFKKADEASTNLTKALNNITFWGVIVASAGVAVAVLNLILGYLSK